MRLPLRPAILLLVGLAALAPLAALATLGGPVLSWPAAALVVLVLAGVGAAAWVLTDGIGRALRGAAAAARRLAAGDWRAPVDVRGPVELRRLGADLELLRAHLAARPEVPAGTAGRMGGPIEALTADLARRTQELAILHAVAAAATRPPDRRAILDQLLSELVSYLGIDAAVLYVEPPDGAALEMAAQAGHSSTYLKLAGRLPREARFAARVAAAGGDAPAVVEELSAAPLPGGTDPPDAAEVLRAEGFRALVGVPVAEAGRLLGILALAARAPWDFGASQRQFLRTLAQQLGAVLAGASLAREAERRMARLQALARLTRSIAASAGPQEALYLTVLAAVQLLDLAYVRVWLAGPADGALQPGPWHEPAGQAEEAADSEAGGDGGSAARWAGDLGPEEVLASLAAGSDEALFISRISADGRCGDPAWWADRGVVSVAAVPLAMGERRLGALVVAPRGPSAFPPEDRELLDLLAAQGAAAYESARLALERPEAAPRTLNALETAETQFEAVVGRVVGAIGRAPDLGRAADALEAGAQEALGLGAVRVAVVDAGGALWVRRGGDTPPLLVPADHPASLAARAVGEGAMQGWDGSGPCWEAEAGLVARAAVAVPLLVEDEGPAGPGGASAVACLLLGSPAEGVEIGVDALARAERLAHEAAPAVRRLRELEAARAACGRLEALLQVDLAVAETHGIGAALEAIADGARRILDAGAAGVFRIATRPDGSGRLVRQMAGSPHLFAGVELDARTGLVAAALGAGTAQAAVLPAAEGSGAPRPGDLGRPPPQGKTLEALVARAGFHAVAAAPIVKRSVLSGVLAVCRADTAPFGTAQTGILAGLAARAGAVWDEREHLEDLEAHAGRFAMINDLVQAAGATRDLDRVEDLLIARLRQVLGCDAASLAFDETERGMVRFARDLAAEEGAASAFSVPAAETSVPMAMALQEPVVIPDLDDSRLPLHRRWAEAGFRSLAEVPLVADGRSCGALLVANRTRGGFPPDRVELLTLLAATMAPILANAQRLAELERTSRDFKVAQEHLAHTEDLRAVGQVATAMGHGVGDRLVAILGRVREAIRQAQDPTLLDGLRQIEKDAEECVETMRRLTRMTRPHRIEGGRLAVDLGEVARQACEMTRARWRDEAQARGATITMVPDLPPVPRVQGDPVALREVLITAILNATHALPRGGTITVRARPQARDGVPGVRVEVADTGVGMPEALRAKVLESAASGAGAGLGLASARTEVERHGGHMAIESAVGKGTTVGFWVPTGEIAPVAWAQAS